MARTSAAACRRRPRSSSWSHNAAYRSSMARSSIIRPYIEATDALGTPSADPIQLPNQSRLFLRVALARPVRPTSPSGAPERLRVFALQIGPGQADVAQEVVVHH